MQLIFRNDGVQFDEYKYWEIIDIVPREKDGANRFSLFAVRLDNKTEQSIVDRINQSCLENDITMLKTITIRFLNVPLDVIQVKDHPNWDGLADVKKYTFENHYKGDFRFCNEHLDEFLLDRSLAYLFLNKKKTHFQSNLDLMFIPADTASSNQDTSFLDRHQTNIFQTIRLKFITRDEVIRTNNLKAIRCLKNLIKVQFGFAPYQQTLFHNNRQLDEEELLTDLFINEHGSELVINVAVSKVNTIKVYVRCCGFEVKKDEQSSALLREFSLQVEDNLLIKDLRKIVQDRIGSTFLEIDFNHLDDVVLCETRDKEDVRADVYKVIHIKFMYEGRTSVYERSYNVRESWETVKEMKRKFTRLEFQLDPEMNDSAINLEATLGDLDFGACIYFREIKGKWCNIS